MGGGGGGGGIPRGKKNKSWSLPQWSLHSTYPMENTIFIHLPTMGHGMTPLPNFPFSAPPPPLTSLTMYMYVHMGVARLGKVLSILG